MSHFFGTLFYSGAADAPYPTSNCGNCDNGTSIRLFDNFTVERKLGDSKEYLSGNGGTVVAVGSGPLTWISTPNVNPTFPCPSTTAYKGVVETGFLRLESGTYWMNIAPFTPSPLPYLNPHLGATAGAVGVQNLQDGLSFADGHLLTCSAFPKDYS